MYSFGSVAYDPNLTSKIVEIAKALYDEETSLWIKMRATLTRYKRAKLNRARLDQAVEIRIAFETLFAVEGRSKTQKVSERAAVILANSPSKRKKHTRK